ncbi:hypothetical protein DL93DRAFT_2224613 [Clavulina sp. PMI_390]|nr:hypothetical protein DL93DRAFT_2224613 [Clavulina sp. PMI_390]
MPKASQRRHERRKAQGRHPISQKGDTDAELVCPQVDPVAVSPRTPSRQRRDPPLPPAKRAKRLETIQSIVDELHEPQQAEATSLASIAAPIFGPAPPPKEREPISPQQGPGEYIFIGFNPQLQALMDRCCLPWAVQYEVSRYRTQPVTYQLSSHEWEDIFTELRKANLATRTEDGHPDGNNTEARQVFPLVQAVFQQRRRSKDSGTKEAQLNIMSLEAETSRGRAKDPYIELDFEEKAILAGSGAGLGVSPNSPNGFGWYGGQVAQRVALTVQPTKSTDVVAAKPTTDQFNLVLMKHKIAPSNRVARKIGSRRVLQISISDEAKQCETLRDYFVGTKFVLNGRIYEAICAKEGTVYLIETGTYAEGGVQLPPFDYISNNGRMSWEEFINWHNPIRFNSHQAISKWSARLPLALSRSTPVCVFDPLNISEIDDTWNGGKKYTWEVMTDGCGFMNRAVAVQVQKAFNLKDMPSAIQARVGGVKGMFMLHPSPDENAATQTQPRLWCRSSQVKIRYGQHFLFSSDTSQLTLDVLRCSKSKIPANSSKDVIVCLYECGVDASIFIKILLEALDKKFESLATWDNEDACIQLWRAIFDLEHVLQGRLRREKAGHGEVADRLELDPELEVEDECGHTDMAASKGLEQSFDTSAGPGLPEEVLQFLMQGYHPNRAPILLEKLGILIRKIILEYVSKYRLIFERSAEAYAVPDPGESLQEGEIYFRSSTPWKNPDGSWSDTIIGPVLATRHPCKVASDIQKFTAVDRPELRGWVDVVIFSRKGKRSPLSLMGGGDYDGDTVIVIFEPDIVNAFRNAPLLPGGLCQGDPPEGFIEKFFDNSPEMLDEHLEKKKDPTAVVRVLQKAAVAPLENDYDVGMYSKMAEKAGIMLGFHSAEKNELAQKFCLCLDGAKAGRTIKPSTRNEDKQRWDSIGLPPSRGGKTGFTEDPHAAPIHKVAKRDSALRPDVIELLWEAGQKKAIEFRDLLAGRIQKLSWYNDPALREPFESACARASASKNPVIGAAMLEDIENIKKAVDFARGAYDKRPAPKGQTWKQRRDIIDSIARELKVSIRALDLVVLSPLDKERVAASYAYVMDMDRCRGTSSANKGTHFPFDMMFHELANIKAQSQPNSATITQEFLTSLVVHSSFLRKG